MTGLYTLSQLITELNMQKQFKYGIMVGLGFGYLIGYIMCLLLN